MIKSKALKENLRYLSRIQSKTLFHLSRFWWRLSFVLVVFVPIAVSILLSKFLDRYASLEKESFFVNCAEPVWATCSATFGFFLSIFFIALTKQELIFGQRYQKLYLDDLWRPASLEYQLVYWEVVTFMNGLRCLIFADSFSLFFYSLILGFGSIVSFGIVFFTLTLSDEAYWFRYLRHKGYFVMTPFFRRQSLSLPNLCEGRFKVKKYLTLSSILKISSISDCLAYFNKTLDNHGSVYPDFDVFIFMLTKAPIVFDCDYDLLAFNATLPDLFALANRLDEVGMDQQAKELRTTIANCLLGLTNSPLIQRGDSFADMSVEDFTGLSGKKKDQIALLNFEACSNCGALIAAFEEVIPNLMRGKKLVDGSYRKIFYERFLLFQAKNKLLFLLADYLSPSDSSFDAWVNTLQSFSKQDRWLRRK